MRRYYIDIDGKRTPVPAVSTILKQSGWGKERLIWWANNQGLQGNDLEAARRPALDIGSTAHALWEADVKGLEEPDLSRLPAEIVEPARRAYGQWLEWKGQRQFSCLASELELTSQTLMYGGKSDMVLADVQGRRSLIECKTAKGFFCEHIVQGMAYIWLWNENHPADSIARLDLLRFGKEGGLFSHLSLDVDHPACVAASAAFGHWRALHDLEAIINRALS